MITAATNADQHRSSLYSMLIPRLVALPRIHKEGWRFRSPNFPVYFRFFSV